MTTTKSFSVSIFQIISFNNDACDDGSGKTGTCFTEPECSDRGGTDIGSCAEGFGVCCQFTLGCGDRSNENCTYFDSDAATAGACEATICPCNDNICQVPLFLPSPPPPPLHPTPPPLSLWGSFPRLK